MPRRKTKGSTTRERSGTDGILSDERNWSELPEDILHLFSKKLPDISDFIRFRAVCKRWQLSAPVTDAPPQLPWIIEWCNFEHKKNDIIRFYSLLSGEVHAITCPGSGRAWLEGPGCRYLLANHRRKSEKYLLNPLTREQIHVPLVDSSVMAVPDYIGPDPIEGGDIVVMSLRCVETYNTNMMAFWRPGADNCVYVRGVSNNDAHAFYMGQYFCSNRVTGITNVIDIATKKTVYQVAPPEGTNPLLNGHTIIVESGGKIVRLFQYYHYESEQWLFVIYCLYFGDGEGKSCWVKITDIGDQMLFLQYNRGLSFCASNFAGFKGNCIYYLQVGRKCLCRYDIGYGTTEVLPCPFVSAHTWFVPSLVKLSDIK